MTMDKTFMFNMTPELDLRLRNFAEERGWSIGAAVRYFLEDGLDGEARRSKLAAQAVGRMNEAHLQALVEEFGL
jgi:predicted DNA-binding protein